MAKKTSKKVRYFVGVGAGCAPALALTVPAAAAQAAPAAPRSGKAVTIPRHPATGCTGSREFIASLGNIKFHGWDASNGWIDSMMCVGTVVVQLQFNLANGQYYCKSTKVELDSGTAMPGGMIWEPFWTKTHTLCRTGPGTASTTFSVHQNHQQPVMVEVRSQNDGGHPAWYNTANGSHTVR